jgi:hypothetical protein
MRASPERQDVKRLNGQMVPSIGQMISSPAIIEFYAQLVEVHDPFPRKLCPRI